MHGIRSTTVVRGNVLFHRTQSLERDQREVRTAGVTTIDMGMQYRAFQVSQSARRSSFGFTFYLLRESLFLPRFSPQAQTSQQGAIVSGRTTCPFEGARNVNPDAAPSRAAPRPGRRCIPSRPSLLAAAILVRRPKHAGQQPRGRLPRWAQAACCRLCGLW